MDREVERANDYMKRICASIGLAAIGVASIQSAHGQSVDPSRSWGASVALRGFYDDNVNSTANGLESFGFEVSPALSFVLPLEQTYIAGSYAYDYKWYDEVINGSSGHDDQTHTFAAQLRHSFTERLVMSVQDSFVIGQEPDMLRVENSALGTFQRIPGDNMRNYGSVVFSAQLTRPFGIEVGYANALYNYADDSDFGESARMDRIEHVAHIDGRWTIQRDTVGIVGYQFSLVDYTADLPVGYALFSSPPYVRTLDSSSRNSLSHYAYVGLEHTFRPDLMGNIKGGARYSDYYNAPSQDTTLSPYFQGSLRWTYAKESFLNVGVSYDLSSTDQYSYSVSDQSITVGANSFVVYASLTHRILPNLFGSLAGNYQNSAFVGGTYDQKSQDYYSFGVNLEYRFNRHVSANVGYGYDQLHSDPGVAQESFERNRVYVGATVTY
jgi:hypothetical protein